MQANGCNSACSTLLTAGPNIACAAIVLKQQGITAWYGYKNHECVEVDVSVCKEGGSRLAAPAARCARTPQGEQM